VRVLFDPSWWWALAPPDSNARLSLARQGSSRYISLRQSEFGWPLPRRVQAGAHRNGLDDDVIEVWVGCAQDRVDPHLIYLLHLRGSLTTPSPECDGCPIEDDP